MYYNMDSMEQNKVCKYMYAIGGNPEAAKVSGVKVVMIQVIVFAIAAILYSIAAVLEVGRIGSASNTTGNAYEMDAIAACVVGGVSMSGGIGSVGGIVIGVLIFTVINYGLAFIGVICIGSILLRLNYTVSSCY